MPFLLCTAGGSDLSTAFDEVTAQKTELPPNPVAYKVISHSFYHPSTFTQFIHIFPLILFFCILKSILKKSVTMQPAPSAVYHYSDTGGHSGHVQHNKVNAIFQAAKKDLLKIIQLQAKLCSAWNN